MATGYTFNGQTCFAKQSDMGLSFCAELIHGGASACTYASANNVTATYIQSGKTTAYTVAMQPVTCDTLFHYNGFLLMASALATAMAVIWAFRMISGILRHESTT
ncbi:MAG: hypothetical protein ABL892_09260 [Thiobacillaceae bacterium]